MAWLSGWLYRKPLVLTGGASGAQTDFQLDIDIAHVTAKMQADFDDIRFTQNDGTTLIDAWLESKVDSTSAETWAEFPTTPANTVEQTYYLYYGKADAVNYWDIGATFIFGDDAESGVYSDKWVDITGTGEYSTDDFYQGSKCIKFSAVDDQTSVSKDINVSDCIFEAMVKGAAYANMLTARASQSAKTYYGYRPDYTGDKAQLYSRIDGSWVLEDEDVYGDDLTTWHKWSILCSGTSIKTYFDNALRNETTDDTIASGGLGTRCISVGGMYYDDVRIRKYAANPPTYAFGAEESAPAGILPQLLHLYNQMRQ